MSKYRDMDRITRAGKADKPVREPMFGGCWGLVKVYVGQLMGPDYVGCSKNARPGHLTCHWHRDREDAAQALKARLDAKKEAGS